MHTAKILVVEDDMGISHVMQAIFTINKIDAVFASTGEKAMSILGEQPFDLILCDIMLPDMLGYEILNYVKSHWQLHRTPFIFLTAFANPEDIRQGMNEGADDYITKPFSAQQLVAAIQSRLNLKRKREQFDIEALNERWYALMTENFQHEFMTPLNGIMQASTLMQIGDAAASAAELQRLARIIESSGRRMMRNIRKLTLFSVVSTGKLQAFTPMQTEFIDDFVGRCLTHLAKHHNLSYEAEDWKLPHRCFNTHPHYCNYMLTEIVENALRHGTGSFPTMDYEITGDDKIRIRISNPTKQDIRFSEEDIAAFRKFHSDNDLNGLGIGLYVAKQLARTINWSFEIAAADYKCVAVLNVPLEKSDFIRPDEGQRRQYQRYQPAPVGKGFGD